MTSTVDWIVAVSTAAGAVGTVATLGFLAWQWVSDRRNQRREAHRQQARKVNCWLEAASIHDTGELSELERIVAADLHWQNLSDAPVSQLQLVCVLEPVRISGVPISSTEAILPEQWQDSNQIHIATAVAPQSVSSKHVNYTFRGIGATSPPEATEPILIWWFTDAAGVTWRKSTRGEFSELKPDPKGAGAIWAEVFGHAFKQGANDS
jgi:hypothetical protein